MSEVYFVAVWCFLMGMISGWHLKNIILLRAESKCLDREFQSQIERIKEMTETVKSKTKELEEMWEDD